MTGARVGEVVEIREYLNRTSCSRKEVQRFLKDLTENVYMYISRDAYKDTMI